MALCGEIRETEVARPYESLGVIVQTGFTTEISTGC